MAPCRVSARTHLDTHSPACLCRAQGEGGRSRAARNASRTQTPLCVGGQKQPGPSRSFPTVKRPRTTCRAPRLRERQEPWGREAWRTFFGIPAVSSLVRLASQWAGEQTIVKPPIQEGSPFPTSRGCHVWPWIRFFLIGDDGTSDGIAIGPSHPPWGSLHR